jgi:hypothetical protein
MTTKGGKITIFRAVLPAELMQIDQTETLEKPIGIETKYFAISQEGASAYARKAFGKFGDTEPYTIIKVDVPLSLTIDTLTVDANIDTVVLSSVQLIGLVPELLDYCLRGK